MEIKTAILVDGGFYRKRAHNLFGTKTAEERAEELEQYCKLHIMDGLRDNKRILYRIYYYDCPPLGNTVYHPLTKKNVNLGKSMTFTWTNTFFEELSKKRKFALRLGRLSEIGHGYRLSGDSVKALCSQKTTVAQLTEKDFSLDTEQKGVDMKIGIDIAHLSYKKLVDQIILISGDSDFVPAAKLARREGIDFIIDPMKSHIADDMMTHADGVFSHWKDNRIPKAPDALIK